MLDRTVVIQTMLTAMRHIVESERFAADAITYANIANDLEDHGTADALRTMAVSRRVEVMALRAGMTELAVTLAGMPLDAE